MIKTWGPKRSCGGFRDGTCTAQPIRWAYRGMLSKWFQECLSGNWSPPRSNGGFVKISSPRYIECTKTALSALPLKRQGIDFLFAIRTVDDFVPNPDENLQKKSLFKHFQRKFPCCVPSISTRQSIPFEIINQPLIAFRNSCWAFFTNTTTWSLVERNIKTGHGSCAHQVAQRCHCTSKDRQCLLWKPCGLWGEGI